MQSYRDDSLIYLFDNLIYLTTSAQSAVWASPWWLGGFAMSMVGHPAGLRSQWHRAAGHVLADPPRDAGFGGWRGASQGRFLDSPIDIPDRSIYIRSDAGCALPSHEEGWSHQGHATFRLAAATSGVGPSRRSTNLPACTMLRRIERRQP